MRQIVLERPGCLVERRVSAPRREPGMVLVRVRRVGICGSDFHAYAGRQPAYTFPRVLGHELAGEVLEVPQESPGLRPGDRCAIEPYVSCGVCRPCRLGRYNCCQDLKLYGLHIDGGMQPLLNVPPHLIHPSATLSYDQLALVETLGIGAHAVSRAQLQPGESTLVVGAGPIGLAVAQFAVAVGAHVQVVERNPVRLEFARRLGLNASERLDEQLFDAVFDATGSAEMMARSLELVAPAGRLVFVGLCPGTVTLNDPLFHKREITLYASRNSAGQFPRVIQLMEQGKLDTSSWITHRLKLTEVPVRMPALLGRPELIKAVVEIEDSDLEV